MINDMSTYTKEQGETASTLYYKAVKTNIKFDLVHKPNVNVIQYISLVMKVNVFIFSVMYLLWLLENKDAFKLYEF